MTATTVKSILCWNCEGQISSEDDACPYCGVQVEPGEEAMEEAMDAPRSFAFDASEHIVASAHIQTGEWSKKAWISVFLLLPGAVFLLFATALAFFSHDGYLVLRWKGSLWPYFFVPSLILLYYGWRSIDSLPDEPEEG